MPAVALKLYWTARAVVQPSAMSTRRPKEESLIAVMARVSRALKLSMQATLEPHGVHAGQNFILERLWERDGQTPGEIAVAIGVEGPTVVRALKRMAAA